MKKCAAMLAAVLLAAQLAACGAPAAQSGSGAPSSRAEQAPSSQAASQPPEEAEATMEEAVQAARQMEQQKIELFEAGDREGILDLFVDRGGAYADAVVDFAGTLQQWYTQYDQHMIVPLAQVDGEYAVGLYHAICAGAYPDVNCNSSFGVMPMMQQDGQWKFMAEAGDALTRQVNLLAVGQDAMDAQDAGRNMKMFGAYWACLGPVVVKGNLSVELANLYQAENGDMILHLYAYNGTDANRSISDIQVEVTDSELGTVISGPMGGSAILPAGEAHMLTCTVPAENVLTGTQPLGELRCSVNYDHE